MPSGCRLRGIGRPTGLAWRLVVVVLVSISSLYVPLIGVPTNLVQAADTGDEVLIGTSVLGRPIVGYQRRGSDAARHIAVIGVIHGDERAGRAVTDALLSTAPPANLTLTVIPSMNPDGEALGQRSNAHGVDLNRNFPFGWLAAGASPHTGSGEYPGQAALSEPESQAMHRWLAANRPDFVLWYHQPWNSMVCDDGSGWECPAFASAVGLTVERAPRPGSAADWASSAGMPSAVVELPARPMSGNDVAAHVAAIVGLYRVVSPQLPLPTPQLSSGLLSPATFHPQDVPVRIVDTRVGDGPMGNGERRRITVPTTLAASAVTAASVTLVATQATGTGYLAVGPTAGSTSALNFQADSPATSQHLTVALSEDDSGRLGFDVVAVGAATQLIVDLDGVYSTDASGSRFNADGPRRVLDTRTEHAVLTGSRRFEVPGIPADADTVELHITAIGEGWLSVWPGDRDWPGTSSLNVHHELSDASVTVRVSSDDAIWLLAPQHLHVIIDVLGYHSRSRGLLYQAASSPSRIFDTRLRSGTRPASPLTPGEEWILDLTSAPVATAAASLNVTSIGGGGGWSVLWASGPRPWASVAQHVNHTVAVATQSPLPVHDGHIFGFSTAAGAHLAIDFYGAFVTD